MFNLDYPSIVVGGDGGFDDIRCLSYKDRPPVSPTEEIFPFPHFSTGESVYYLEHVSEEEILISGEKKLIRYDLKKKDVLIDFEGHSRTIWFLKYFPRKNFFLSCGWDGVMKIWNPNKNEPLKSFAHEEKYINCAEYFEWKNLIVTCNGTGLHEYDAETGKEIDGFLNFEKNEKINPWSHRVAFVESISPSTLVFSHDGVTLVDLNSGKFVGKAGSSTEYWAVRYQNEKQVLVCVSHGRTVLYDIRRISNPLRVIKSHVTWSYRIRLLDRDYFCIGIEDQEVKVFDFEGKCRKNWELNQKVFGLSYFGDLRNRSFGESSFQQMKEDFRERLEFLSSSGGDGGDKDTINFDYQVGSFKKRRADGVFFEIQKIRIDSLRFQIPRFFVLFNFS